MTMKRIAVLLMLAALSSAAQDDKNTPPKPPAVTVQKLFVLQYADPEQVYHFLMMLGGSFSASREMHAIAAKADQREMTVIEDAIKQLDVPSAAPKNIELTVNLIVGTEAEGGLGGAVPKELESVVTQLKGAFPFKSYRQVDQIELRTRTGERATTRSEGAVVSKDSLSGCVVDKDGAKPQATTITTDFAIRAASLAQDGSSVRLDEMEASINWPGIANNLRLHASVDVKEGQKVVVGRIGVAHDQALFVVLTAHLVQ
jgi:hypothetical protein